MTQRNNLHWGTENWYGQNNNLSYTYENNRITNTGWEYDFDGRVTQSSLPDDSTSSSYDARGLLIQHYVSAGGNSIVRRYYNGDGREIKREKTVYDEQEEEWVVQNPEYFIRSSVLGGQTLTEVNSLGRKIKTNVIAAGATIATQSEYTYNNNTNESVSWNHTDAGGMSHRSTTSSGSAVYGDGQYDGAPAELDPLGGNMGLATPYVEQLIEPPPPSEEFPFFPMTGDAPMYVNGQQVTCTLDGMGVPCSMALGMLGHSADIDFAHTDPWVLSGLGISAYPIYGTRTINNAPGTAPNDTGTGANGPIVIHSNTTTEQYFIGWGYNISWAPQNRQNRDDYVTAEKLPLGTKISPRRPETMPCDQTTSRIFGDDSSILGGSGFDIRNGRYFFRENSALNPGVRETVPESWPHVYGYAGHLFARSADADFGYAKGNVFVPPGYTDWSPFTDDGAWFYYRSSNSTILVMHVDPARVAGNLRRNIRNAAGSIFIGQTTDGGGGPGYYHSHLEAHRGRGVPNADRTKFPNAGDRAVETQRLRNKTRLFFPDQFCPR